jgi:imidazolonepropionase
LVTCRARGEDLLGIVTDGAFTVERGRVTWVGTAKEFREKSFGRPSRLLDAEGKLVVPGFVAPHTHLLFAGSREDELERKASGESYISILKKGGGIARTVRDTRKASATKIVEESKGRILQLARNGVTTVEVKTGYGQNLAGEMKLLDGIDRLREEVRVELVSTFMGLHALPPEFSDAKSYVDEVLRRILPRVAGRRSRPRFSDCFCEEGVFSSQECSRYLRSSAGLGFGLKVHADEFSESGGAQLAADLGCVSADHLGRSIRDGVRSMAKKGVTAVLLPGTSLYSGIPYADARTIMKLGCDVALGTDLSPNSWIESPQVVMGLACTAMRMTPAQALLGFTHNAAKALSRKDIGTLEEGSSADFDIISLPSYRFLPYRVGGQYVRAVFKAGEEVFSADMA